MTWLRLILFAVISGVVTGLVALLVPEGNSFRQIAVMFEAWIVLAIIVVVNCGKPLEAACKTFVYFLISQPMVYLVQVPFNPMGWNLFGYYRYWFFWTLATFPGALIAWFIKRDDWISSVILSVALAALILQGCGYLKTLIGNFPQYLISTLFCFGMVPVLIVAVLHRKNPRRIASAIAAAALAALLFLTFRGGAGSREFMMSISLEEELYPVTEGWTAELEDPDNGTVELFIGNEFSSSGIRMNFLDYEKNTTVILKDPDGNVWRIPVVIEKDETGFKVSY